MVHCMRGNFTCPGKISDVPHIINDRHSSNAEYIAVHLTDMLLLCGIEYR